MRYPRTVSLYLLREVGTYTLVGLAAVSLVFIGGNLVRRLADFLLIGVALSDVMVIVRSVVLVTLAYTVPLSFLFGALVGVGRLAADSEIVALRASGIGLRDLVLPVFALGFLVSCLTWYIALEVEHRAKRQIRDVVVSITASGRLIEPRRFKQLGDRMFYVASRDRDNRLEGVFIADQSDPERPLLIFAEEGDFSLDAETHEVRVRLRDGDVHMDGSPGSQPDYYRMSFHVLEYAFQVSLPRADDFSQLRPRDMTMQELRDIVDRARDGESISHLWKEEVEYYEVQIHRRYALPVAPMIFALLAVPLSLRRSRGAHARGAMLCALLALAYYVVLSFSQYVALSGLVPAAVALWWPNGIFAALAAWLLARARRVPA